MIEIEKNEKTVSLDELKEEKKNHKHTPKKEDIITFTLDKVTIWKGVSAVLGILVVFMFFTGDFGKDTAAGNALQPTQVAPSPSPAPSPQPQARPTNLDMKILADDDVFKGSEDAPVTIVEFSDFQCPFCRKHYTQTMPQLEQDYISTGKVKYVYRDFPLSFHPGAQSAAEAGECAEEQDKFWEYHDKIFDEQNKQGSGTVQFTVTDLKQWAADIGLDTGKFNECLDSGKYTQEVKKDFADGGAAGITGTPGFIINGKSLVGAQPYSVFQQIIEAELGS